MTMGRPLRIALPRPTRRGSARAFLVIFFLASVVVWILMYNIPASPWNRWYPPAWHPAIYNPPPSLNRKWWRIFGESRRWGTGPDPPHPSARVQPPASPFYTTTELDCASQPGAQDVLYVVKTGATETHSKLPVHFKTTFRCTPNFDIYSDLDEMIHGHTVHNAIDDIPSSRMVSFPEFDLYNEQLDSKRRGRKDVAGLSHDKHLHVPDVKVLAQNLDRWKFLSMLEKALLTKPTAKWFVFVEADTAVLWSNLLLWLSKLPPHTQQYLGAQAFDGELEFAMSGAGWILSNSAMRTVTEAMQHDPPKYDDMIADNCCGDRVVAAALQAVGIPLTRSRPILQSEPPSSVAFTPARWCSPIVSFHRMSPGDVRDVWSWEQKWTAAEDSHDKGPILHRDIFWAFIAPGLTDSRTSWDNLSADQVFRRPDKESVVELSDTEVAAVRSASGCARLCTSQVECLQWRYRKGECALGESVRLGAAQSGRKGSDNHEVMTSGWMRARIEAFVEQQEPCDDPQWVTAHV